MSPGTDPDDSDVKEESSPISILGVSSPASMFEGIKAHSGWTLNFFGRNVAYLVLQNDDCCLQIGCDVMGLMNGVRVRRSLVLQSNQLNEGQYIWQMTRGTS